MTESYKPKTWNNRTPYDFAMKRIMCLNSIVENYASLNDISFFDRADILCHDYFLRFSMRECVELVRGMIYDEDFWRVMGLKPMSKYEIESTTDSDIRFLIRETF